MRYYLTAPIAERFWAKVDKHGPKGCWEWTGSIRNTGYGQFSMGHGAVVLAHRFSWFMAHGVQPTLFVCHHCDNRRCVRPDHLFLGSVRDNIQDAIEKGRMWRVAPRLGLVGRPAPNGGQRHHMAKLSDRDVMAIRAEYSGRAGQIQDLANRYHVSPACIYAVIVRKTWKHLP